MAKAYALMLLVLTIEFSKSLDSNDSDKASENLSSWKYNKSFEVHVNSKQFNFSAFTNLISVHLYLNSKLNMTSIPGLENMPALNLSSNRITSLNLTSLHNLVTLDLSNNSVINLSKLHFPTNLNNLNLTLNKIQIVNNIKFPLNLNTLNMSNDNLTTKEEVHLIGRLKILDLRNNNITSVEGIGNLTALEELYLSNNSITKLHDKSFSGLSTLLILDLSHNRIENLTEQAFTGLYHLQTLDLSNNLLLMMEPGTFQYMDNLISLKLCGNTMSGREITDQNSMLIETGQRLQTIDVSRTNITNIPVILTRSVRNLFAASNNIFIIQRGDLDSYPLLKVLNLSRNFITLVEDDALGRLEFLTELYLSHNLLKTIPRVLPDSLKSFDINTNNVEALTPNDFTGLPKLKELILSRNKITVINEETFGQLISLEHLDISGNPIKTLSSNVFIGPRRLKSLILTSLHDLVPSPEPLSFPVPESGNLEFLSLASSPVLAYQLLDDIAALTMFRQLSELNLSNTNLTFIRSDLFHFLPRLKTLNLDGNVLNCTDIVWLSQWFRNDENETDFDLQNLQQESKNIRKVKRIDYRENSTEPVCFFPNRLKGRSLYNLTINDFPEMNLTSTFPPASLRKPFQDFNFKQETTTENVNSFTETTQASNKTKNYTNTNDTFTLETPHSVVVNNNKTVQKIEDNIRIKSDDVGYSLLVSERTLVSIQKQRDLYVNNTVTQIKDNQFVNLTLNKNTSVLVISNETMRVAGKMDAFSAKPVHTGSHPGMFVFLTGICVLVLASVIMMASHWTQYRKRKELTRGYVQQQDIEVQSLSSAVANDLW